MYTGGDMVWTLKTGAQYTNRHDLYESVPVEVVVGFARSGNSVATDYLLNRFRGIIERKATMYFYQGAEREDIVQEGMIGLYKAILDFRMDGQHHFPPFAELCITRQILSAIKSATREKHMILNKSVSLETSLNNDQSDGCIGDFVPDNRTTSAETLCMLNYETDKKLERAATVLTNLENRVLQGYIAGETYQELQESLCVSYRTIDNALQRIKKKLSHYDGS